MSMLQDFVSVQNNLRQSKKCSITALHKFVFEQEGDRSNRKRLREFRGFQCIDEDMQYQQKSAYVQANLSDADLISICIVLGLNYDVEDKTRYIFNNLRENHLLEEVDQQEVDDDEDDVENVHDDETSNGYQHDIAVARITDKSREDESNKDDDHGSKSIQRVSHFALNFRDIEDSVRHFDGSGKQPVESWIEDFEETASMMYWDDFQKLVFAKKSLRGIAKLFVDSERNITSWTKLKKALIDEFKVVVSSARIHKNLSERTMNRGETVEEYFYYMKDLASQGNITNDDLMQYVIDGINDINSNKAMLYGASNLIQFKQKLRDYGIFSSKQKGQSEVRIAKKLDMVNRNKPESGLKCFNCGARGHKSMECQHKNKGTKCFRCNNFGHMGKDCTNKREGTDTKLRCLKYKKDEAMKIVEINGYKINTLFDTGSIINVVKEKLLDKIHAPALKSCDIVLTGFGSTENKIRPLGVFTAEVEIDGETFQLDFHVASDSCLDVDMVIGYPLCEQAELTFTASDIQIRKTYEAKIMNINIEEESDADINIEKAASPEAKQIVLDMVQKFQPEKTMTTNVSMKILLEDESPIASRPRRLPFSERKVVEEQVERWLQEGVIENSESEFSSPVVLVTKKDGIEHRCGTAMRHVDALSRYPVRRLSENLLSKIKQSQISDDNLKSIFEILKQRDEYDGYYLKSGILYKLYEDCEKIVVPKNMQYEVIKIAHEKGHFGVKKTKDMICYDYFIPKLDDKVHGVIANCIPCLLVNRKQGKQEGELHPLPKPDVPLHTYHADFLGPLETTSKKYKHLFVVVDAFTKFCWIYPTKTTSASCAISKLQLQSTTFGNPYKIVTDRGSAFTSDEFRQYCDAEGIQHARITTGLPRANGQVERLNGIIEHVLAKISISDPTKWYKHVESVQRFINSSVSRTTSFTPFELLTGVRMKNKEDLELKRLVEAEVSRAFSDDRDHLRQMAKAQIQKTQEENRKYYNLRRKSATNYKPGDLIAIKRTQFGGGLKLKAKFLGPYRVEKAKGNHTYDVCKVGDGEGPAKTTTCAEFIKPWPRSEFETN